MSSCEWPNPSPDFPPLSYNRGSCPRCKRAGKNAREPVSLPRKEEEDGRCK